MVGDTVYLPARSSHTSKSYTNGGGGALNKRFQKWVSNEHGLTGQVQCTSGLLLVRPEWPQVCNLPASARLSRLMVSHLAQDNLWLNKDLVLQLLLIK